MIKREEVSFQVYSYHILKRKATNYYVFIIQGGSIKGSERRLIEYMEGSKERFTISVYQRNYDQKIENCEQLYDDLIRIIKNEGESHFFGSLVSVYEPSGRNAEFLVIDGRQRLTAASLLLLVMCNLIQFDVVKPIDEYLDRQIYEDLLVDKYQPEETRIELEPVESDQGAFGELSNDVDEYTRKSNLTTNYNYFYEKIQKQEIMIDELFDAIYRSEAINITFNNEDNPQLIPENLNSTGLDLSKGDKIRNFILMGLSSREQDEYYDKYWDRVEVCTKYDVSSLVGDYLSIKQMKTLSQNKTYISFKEYINNKSVEVEVLLRGLLEYAKQYEILLDGSTKNNALDARVYRLSKLETSVTRPFFPEVLRLFDGNKLDMSQVVEVFLITENYVFKRMICGLPANALSKVFYMPHGEIMRYEDDDEGCVEKFKYALLPKKGRARLPDDDEFSERFTKRPVYQMNNKSKAYTMKRMENYSTVEDKDVYGHCDDGTYTVEHIMPQHLTPAQVKAFGDGYGKIHETWLHRVVNLTLTVYNSKYSNSIFKEKKSIKNGFEDSDIRMNTYIAERDEWTLTEFEERSQYLMGRALEIQAAPTSKSKFIRKQMDSSTLDDDALLSRGPITYFSYKNIGQPISSWVEMFQKVLQILYTEDKNMIIKLAVSEENNVTGHPATNGSDFKRDVEIGDGIFAWTSPSTQNKILILNRVSELYDIDPSDLIFYLRDENESVDKKTRTRYESRRKYWAYALEKIKEAHERGNSFNNVDPSKLNWVSGFFGISGFKINCVANLDFAMVKLYLGKVKKEEDKRTFGMLIGYKDDIEKALGVSLVWNREDDMRTLKVSCRLDNVSIKNETDWLQMVKSHAEWNKKFYNVIMPYLRNLQVDIVIERIFSLKETPSEISTFT